MDTNVPVAAYVTEDKGLLALRTFEAIPIVTLWAFADASCGVRPWTGY